MGSIKRYKLVCSNKDGSFTIQPDELDKLIEAKTKNSPAVFREGIVLNWNMYSGLVEDKERINHILEMEGIGNKYEEPSLFAEIAIKKGIIKRIKPGED